MSSDEERAARRERRARQREQQRQREASPAPVRTRPIVVLERQAPRPAYGTRLIAGVIDLLLASVPVLALFFAVSDTAPAGTFGLGGSLDITIGSTEHYLAGGQALLFVVLIVAVWAIVFGLLPAGFGATVGMLAMGLTIVGLDERPVTFGTHMARTAGWLVDGFPYVLPGALAVVCIVATRSRRRLGDLIAGTAVVHVRPPVPSPGKPDAGRRTAGVR